MGPKAKVSPSAAYTPHARWPTSQRELEIDWQYPVHEEEVEDLGERSAAVMARRALPAEEAFRSIAGEDRRPLLVLRECLVCTGTDDALLSRQADNERTMLMSRWFHCVKLPPDVLEEDHPYHSLFAGEVAPHLFFARWNGEGRLDLAGERSRTELWGIMDGFLDSEYRSKPERALKSLLKILDDYDRLDAEILALEVKLDDVIEDDGIDSSKAKKIQRKLDELAMDRAESIERADKVSVLELEGVPKPTE